MSNNKYGALPKEIGIFKVECAEMMFYQYLPIKLRNEQRLLYEKRLRCFSELIDVICNDYIDEFGLGDYSLSYIYLTAKSIYIKPGCPFNRPGWHSDGFMTDDINYIWSDKCPTIFNASEFNLTMNDTVSMQEMNEQASIYNDVSYDDGVLLRLNQYNIHRVSEVKEEGVRTFLKISFSKDKYDLIGNSRNYLLNYNWEMKKRKVSRNIPQSLISNLKNN